MELKSRAAACALLLLLLVLSPAGGGIVAAEARVCTGKSQHHSFPCVSDRLCTRNCVNEGGGWTAGYCRWRVCTCQKAC
ncbi:defensin-like protein 1 [Panicum miliaceum]|uniref:Defensin-like protein 1 n=1 Tax=Panicum miliaceum TaxID=4540 RepID=A0A3L6RMQ6_PANMI|nr:defensin-like protein 1 [Panicum miliaceum]